MTLTTDSTANNRSQPFIIARVFDASRDSVWKCWTEQEHMQWWGPKGVTVEQAKLDLRPGGTFHYCMKTPEGQVMWGKWVIREVTPPERLVFINSFSDAAGGLTRHPMSPTWPLELLSTIVFESQGAKTLLTIKWQPWNATPVEGKTFDEGHESMKNGWGGTLDRLEAYLWEVKAGWER